MEKGHNEKKTGLIADLVLLLVTLSWGLSYYGMDIGLRETETFSLNAYRFLGAFIIAGIFSIKRLIGVNNITLAYAALIAALLSLVYTGATIGIANTTMSNTAFLCSTTVVITPIVESLVFKRRPGTKTIIAVFLCAIGIMLLVLKEDFSINADHLKGDLWSLSTGFAYALDIVMTEKAVSNKRVDPYRMGVFSLGFVGIFMLIMSFLMEDPAMPVPHSPFVIGAIIFLAVFCTGFAFIAQPIAQQHTVSSHVGIIFSLEPVFAGIAEWLIEGNTLTGRGYFGAFLMLFAVIFMEVGLPGSEKKNKTE